MTPSPAPIRSRRRILAPLATLLVAGAIAIGSGANFTSTSSNPANLYATGTLTQANSKADSAIFRLSNLKPGDTLDGEVTITNTGSLPATFTLSEVDPQNGFANPANLRMSITDTGSGATVFDGTFGTTGTKALGTFKAGEARTYRFRVLLATSAGNAEQARTATATYTWDAVQTEGEATAQPATTPAVDTHAG